MKKLILLVLIVTCFAYCKNQNDSRYKKDSNEIELLKASLEAYEKGDWDSWIIQYADTAKIYQNNWHEGADPEKIKQGHIDLISNLTDYGFSKEDMSMEQIIDEKGRVWVNFWGLWQATLKANNKTIEIPVHLTIQYINGKVVKQYGFWDMTPFNNEMRLIKEKAESNNVDS